MLGQPGSRAQEARGRKRATAQANRAPIPIYSSPLPRPRHYIHLTVACALRETVSPSVPVSFYVSPVSFLSPAVLRWTLQGNSAIVIFILLPPSYLWNCRYDFSFWKNRLKTF